jgi:hypothetical protein
MKRGIIAFLAVILAAAVLAPGIVIAENMMREIRPRKVEKDTNADGNIDRVEHYDKNGMLTSIEADTTGNGQIDEWIYYEEGILVKAAKDTTGDGKPDTWMEY